MAKEFALEKYTDRFHPRYDLSRVFARPAALPPQRSTLYVDSNTGRWFEDNQPLRAPNELLSFLWKEINQQVSETGYQTVLKTHHIPAEGSDASYKTLFVAHVAETLAITVGERAEEIRIKARYAQEKPTGEAVHEFPTHGKFAKALGDEADISPGDFDYFKWRGPVGSKPDNTWESTIRVRREL